MQKKSYKKITPREKLREPPRSVPWDFPRAAAEDRLPHRPLQERIHHREEDCREADSTTDGADEEPPESPTQVLQDHRAVPKKTASH